MLEMKNRSNKMLINGFEDIKILCQYLYMDKENFVSIVNRLETPLEIRMNEDCDFVIKNLFASNRFEDVKNADVTIENLLGIIDYLRESKPVTYPDKYKNRWAEIKDITLAQTFLSKKSVSKEDDGIIEQ